VAIGLSLSLFAQVHHTSDETESEIRTGFFVDLLKQIVLVDDDSNLPELGQQLEEIVAQNFPKIIQILRLPERRGSIKARMEAIKVSSCQVLVFLDSHIEVNTNWVLFKKESINVDKSR